MTTEELKMAFNEFVALYPNQFRNISQDQDRIIKSWEKLYGDLDDCEAFIQALYDFNMNSDYPTPPTPKQWRSAYRNAKNRLDAKNGKGNRRIVTDDEWLYEQYQKEMKKPPEKRNEEMIRRWLPSAAIMNDPELYKKKHGAYREQFERY